MSKISNVGKWPKLYEATIDLPVKKLISLQEMLRFYSCNYEMLCQWRLQPRNKITLRDLVASRCRFCGLSSPGISFRKKAHAIPECLGNKSLFSSYECDACNEFFGNGIENDLGNWSKPMRLLGGVSGKNGVPTIREASGSLRFEGRYNGLAVYHGRDDPRVSVDEINNEITFTFQRDPYTPTAVMKAFVKIGLSILPEIEIPNFTPAFKWISQADHTLEAPFNWPINHTFLPGFYRSSFLPVMVFRRRQSTLEVPYMFFVIQYGNDVFQIFLPSERDVHIDGKEIDFCRFPTVLDFRPNSAETPLTELIEMNETNQIKGDLIKPVMSYGKRTLISGR